MSNLGSLFLTQVRATFNLSKIKTQLRNNPKKVILLILFFIFVYASLVFSVVMYYDYMAQVFRDNGLINVFLISVFSTGTLFSVLTIVFAADGYLFHSKDLSLLLSLPIKPRNIVVVKMLMLLSLTYAFDFLMVFPGLIIYFIYAGPVTFLMVFNAIIMSLFIPLIPLVVFSLLSVLIKRLVMNSRFRQLFIFLGAFLFLGLTLAISFGSSFISNELILNSQNFFQSLNKYYFPLAWFVKGIINGSVLYTLLFILISFVPFALFFIILSKKITTIATSFNYEIKRSNKKTIDYSHSGIFKNIFIKEYKKFFTTPMYFLNMMVFPIMILALGGYVIFKFSDIQNIILQIYYAVVLNLDTVQIPLKSLSITPICIVMLIMSLSTVYSSCVSISMEGNKLWILKSLPIKENVIFYAKIAVCFSLQIVPSFIIVSIVLALINANIIVWISAFIAAILVCSFLSMLGMVINLYFPKLEFKNEMEVYKQSLAVGIFMLGTMALALILGGLYYLLSTKISSDLVITLLFFLILIILNYVVYVIIDRKGTKIFRNL